MNQLTQFWMRLTPLQQAVVVAIIVFIVWRIYKYTQAQQQVLDRITTEKAEVTVLEQNGITLSYPESSYESWADQLFEAMDGPGTYVSEINEVFAKMKNDRDVIQLEKAFGLRSSSYSPSWWADPTDLQDWLLGDMSSDAIAALNKQLKFQGITKQF